MLLALCLLATHSAFAQSIDEKAQVCTACHGEGGIPQEKTTPIIWGQQQGHIDAALSDFKRGRRESDQMAASVRDLGPEVRPVRHCAMSR